MRDEVAHLCRYVCHTFVVLTNHPDDRQVDQRTLRAKTKMIDAAQLIIATKGIDALTLREVQEMAGQKNKSAACYHFGSREGLIAASILRVVANLNGRRQANIDALNAPLDELSLRQLVELLISPHLDGVFSVPSSTEARFLHQCSMHPGLINMMRHRGDSATVVSIRSVLSQRLEHFSPATRVVRLDFVMTLVVSWLAQFEAFRELDIAPPIPSDIARADLIDTCLAMVEYPAESVNKIDLHWSTEYTETWRL